MSPQVLETPDVFIESEEEIERGLPWEVILYNDDFHGFDEVVLQVRKATAVPLQKAVDITMEAHTYGRAVCYAGALERCERVAAILREIALIVEIDRAG